MKPLLSIIVPVYNPGQYFYPCIGSLLSQTISPDKMEIILVDDGSTDGSADICDLLAEQLPEMVSVIHQENSGHCSAPRNAGIEAARGDYIFFHDADDILQPEAAERMLNHALEWNSDTIVLAEAEAYPDGRKVVLPKYVRDGGGSIPCGNKFADCFVEWIDARRLFKKSLLLEHNIRFKETISEDLAFVTEVLFASKTVSLAADYVYVWYIQRADGNISSTSYASPAKSFDGRLDGVRFLLETIDKNNGRDQAYPHLYKKIFTHPVYKMLTTGMDHRDWNAEIKRLPELANLIRPHWDETIAAVVTFTERAVIECLLSGEYDAMPRIRKLCKSLKKAKGVAVNPHDSLRSLQPYLPQGLSDSMRIEIAKRELSSLLRFRAGFIPAATDTPAALYGLAEIPLSASSVTGCSLLLPEQDQCEAKVVQVCEAEGKPSKRIIFWAAAPKSPLAALPDKVKLQIAIGGCVRTLEVPCGNHCAFKNVDALEAAQEWPSLLNGSGEKAVADKLKGLFELA